MNLTQLESLIRSEGKPVIGCGLSAEEAASLARNRYPQRPFCLVESWTLFDVITTDKELALLGARGLKPMIVYALCVVLDSRGRRNPGDWVRSSFQQSYDELGFFLTKNTVYVLLGKGTRKNIAV